VQQLRQLLRRRGRLQAEDVRTVLDVVSGSGEAAGHLTLMESGRGLRARTDGQGRYVQALRTHDVVLCVGPAGTGKTYLAVGWAVGLLRSGQVRKIVLVRPAVEAGERLGFLPGDLVAKVNPYLRPLFDALNEIMDAETVKRYMDNDIIEILPLAYMRGRTLNNAVIILDEGQNATPAQMKMFLTRLGINSKIVVTGDLTQTDLPRSIKSGLEDAVQRLRDVEGVAIVYLDESDIIRNPLVTRIVKAYEEPAAKGKRS
jgi:phosphate starvation-inducible PhoH-like protein